MDQNNNELAVSRYIEAPVDRVWQLMTERLPDWWCPRPWTTQLIELDWRAGGRMALLMRGPDGEESPVEGVFLEVTPPHRMVFTDAVNANWQPRGPFMIGIIELTPQGSGTHYSATSRHWSTEAMEQHRKMGFHEGWSAVAEQLAQLAQTRE